VRRSGEERWAGRRRRKGDLYLMHISAVIMEWTLPWRVGCDPRTFDELVTLLVWDFLRISGGKSGGPTTDIHINMFRQGNRIAIDERIYLVLHEEGRALLHLSKTTGSSIVLNPF
jgi:hypothetical protein